MSVVSPSRAAESILVISFIFEVVGCLSVAGRAPGCPIEPVQAAGALAALLPLLFAAIVLVKRCGRAAVGARLKTMYPDEPMRRSKTATKFADQLWQLVVHVSLSALAYFILRFEDGGVEWLDEPASLWLPSRSIAELFVAPSRASVQLLYLLQSAVWIVTACSHVWLEERHNDYLMMLAHHVVTLALILLSYHYNYLRVGVVIMFLHDSSDIVIDLLKMCNYVNLEGLAGFFAVEICFLVNFGTWAYTRLYIFPVHVLWRGVITAPREIYTAPGTPGMEAFTVAAAGNPYTRGHARGFSLPHDVGRGKFDVVANIIAMPTHANLPLWWSASALLSALLAMNVIWYLMFWRMLWRIATKSESCNDVGDDVYEGDRERSDAATRKVKGQ